MSRSESEGWAAAPRIYVENKRGRDPAYDLTEPLLRAAFAEVAGPRLAPARITVRHDDARDADAWAAAEVLVAGRLDTGAIPAMAGLRLIQTTSAGIEGYMPLDWLPQGVALCNASGVHAEKVAEFGAMAVLMLHDRVPARVAAQARRRWERTLQPASRGRRVLIHGAGALGGAVARGLAGFGFELHGIGRHDSGPRPGFAHVHGPEALDGLLPGTDILVLSAPLTDETRGLFDRRRLGLLPKGAGLLNIARAAILDHDALSDMLREGHLSGAILDVFETEPLPEDSPLWAVPNLMVFPHVSADDPTSYARGCALLLARNLTALLEGRPMPSRVDPALGY